MLHVRPDNRRPQPVSWAERLRRYALLIRLNRPIGAFLLVWPALWALWFAGGGRPPGSVVLVFVLGAVLMRSAGCAINDFADRNFDGDVERTRTRPLVVGLVSPKEAVGVFVVLSLMAFGLVLTLNWPTVTFSVVAVVLTVAYPFMKRFTHFPQLVLGAAFGCAVPMAFTAITGSVPALGWWLFAAAVVGTVIYDTQYSMVDREDDLKLGLKSTAILFGRYDRLILVVLEILMLGMLLGIGLAAGRGAYYVGGLVAASALAAYQQSLVWRRERSRCFRAFLTHNHFGMVVFLGLLLDYALGA